MLLTLYLVERSQAEPDYFHEGEYDLAKDSLLEESGLWQQHHPSVCFAASS